MKKNNLNFRMLLIVIAFLIVGVTAFFLVTKKDSDKKPIKGVFVQLDWASGHEDKL